MSECARCGNAESNHRMAGHDFEPANRAPEFEALEQELYQHQPVLSMVDGSIAGCQCMDRVFYKATEDWGAHLAEVFQALGFVPNRTNRSEETR